MASFLAAELYSQCKHTIASVSHHYHHTFIIVTPYNYHGHCKSEG